MTISTVDLGGSQQSAVDLSGQGVTQGGQIVAGPRGPRGLPGASGALTPDEMVDLVDEVVDEVEDLLEPPVDLTLLYENAKA